MLSDKEVAEIMKKEVPRLLHKRIAELESQVFYLIEACESLNDYMNAETGYRLNSADSIVESAKEILKKEII